MDKDIYKRAALLYGPPDVKRFVDLIGRCDAMLAGPGPANPQFWQDEKDRVTQLLESFLEQEERARNAMDLAAYSHRVLNRGARMDHLEVADVLNAKIATEGSHRD